MFTEPSFYMPGSRLGPEEVGIGMIKILLYHAVVQGEDELHGALGAQCSTLLAVDRLMKLSG